MNFFSDISFWWLLPIAVLSFFLAFFYYQKQSGRFEKKGLLRILTTLRGISLFLLIILLLGIVVKSTKHESQKPIFITLIDDSASMKNYKDSTSVLQNIQQLKNDFSTQLSGKFDIKNHTFSEVLQSKKIDFSGQKTNISTSLQEIYELYFNQNIGGISIVSDGNFNEGMSPLSIAKKMKFVPFFNVGTGDTTLKKDLLIKSVSVNNVAFLDNDFPLEIAVEAVDFPKGKAKVSVFEGKKIVKSKEIVFDNEKQNFQTVEFLLNASQLGVQKYRVEIEKIENESTYKNNTSVFYIDIIDSRRKILLLANAPHPDISAIKSTLEKDEKTKVTTKLFSKWKGDATLFDLVILFHLDKKFLPIKDQLTHQKTPILFIFSSNSSRNFVEQLKLNINYPFGRKLDYTQGGLNTDFQLFSIEESTKKMMERFPPLSVPFGELKAGRTESFIVQKIGSIKKKNPIFSMGIINNQKVGFIFGEGLWKWKLTNYQLAKNTVAFDEIIGKTTQFLTVKKNNDALKITMPKQIYTRKDILIQAELYNANFELINHPKITFELKNEQDEKFNYDFSTRAKDYSLLLNGLKTGIYEWVAQTTFDGKKHIKKGTFVVEPNNMEQISTNANHSILQQLAKETQGDFSSIKNVGHLIKKINQREDLTSITYEKEKFKNLTEYKWWFFLVICLFSLEWFLRRWNGNY